MFSPDFWDQLVQGSYCLDCSGRNVKWIGVSGCLLSFALVEPDSAEL
jgi:hypothetical protein